jgi:hypothetical protein
MSEQITITVSLEQAEAMIDAATCLATAADGNLSDLLHAFTPDSAPDSAASNHYKLEQARHALEGVAELRAGVAGAYKRDPELQDMLHAFKMRRKYGPAA